MTATRPPLRSSDAHWPSAAGSPEHSSATSAPSPPVRSRMPSTVSSAVKSSVSWPSDGRLLQPRAAADDDHAAGAERARELGHQQAHHARPDDHDGVARRMAAALDRVQRDRRRVEHRGLLVGQLVGHREDALDRVHDVVGVRAVDVVAVLLVHAQVAEPLAEVVPALDALAAEPAGGVRRARDARADLPAEVGRARPELDHVAAPLVARDQRPLLGPEARVVALDDVRVGAADRDRAHLAEHLVAAGRRAARRPPRRTRSARWTTSALM